MAAVPMASPSFPPLIAQSTISSQVSTAGVQLISESRNGFLWQQRLVLGSFVLCASFRPWRKGPRASRQQRSAAFLEGTATAVGLDGRKPSTEAPPPGSGMIDELGFLLRNPFARALEVTSVARVELQASPAEVWKILEGPDSWLSLQLTDSYGLPWPLKLASLQGRLEVSSELQGDVEAFGQVIRRFRWKVQKAEFADSTGNLELLGSVVDSEGSFIHSIHIHGVGTGSHVESMVRYTPSSFQSLLNAFGGRSSQHEGHLAVLRRLGGLVDGDVVFDPTAFYNRIGKLIDLVSPFEDVARDAMARLSGLKGTGSQVKVLEIGCGSGRWARSLLSAEGEEMISNVSQYLGIDSSSTMADESAKCLSKVPNARVVRGDARKEGLLQEACESFLFGAPDRIVAAYVLDILDDKDFERVMSTCAVLLRSSGGVFAAASIFPGSSLMDLWESIWQNAPVVVGGCRPKDVSAKLESLGWKVIATEVTDVLGYRSQVVVAKPPP